MRVQKEAADSDLSKAKGRVSAQLVQGDLVAVRTQRRSESKSSKAQSRFDPKVEQGLFTITTVLGPGTFRITPLEGGPERKATYDSSQIVKIQVPNLDNGDMKRRIIEVHDDSMGIWERAEVQKVSVDGRVLVCFEARPAEAEWMDLSRKRYRWREA